MSVINACLEVRLVSVHAWQVTSRAYPIFHRLAVVMASMLCVLVGIPLQVVFAQLRYRSIHLTCVSSLLDG